MRLTIDLRSSPPRLAPADDEQVLTLGELAALAMQPRQLARTLLGRRWENIRVMEDPGPRSGVQAGALGLAALARGGPFTVEDGDRQRRVGRARFATRAAGAALVGLPRELALTAMLARRAAHAAATRYTLPAPAGRPRRITYLRAEPSLRWMGLSVGGAATHTAGVISGLVADGADVHVYAPERPPGTEMAPCTVVPARSLLQLVHWLTLVEHSTTLADAAQGRPVDAVYQRYALGSFAGLELASRLRVPLILEFNGSEIWAERHWGSGRVRLGERLAALEMRNLLDATLVVVVSEPLREQLAEHGIAPERVLVNPNGVDVDALAPLRAQPPAHWRAELGRPEAPTVGFIGTFGLWHGVKLLPELIARVAETHPGARWHLVGDGPLRPEVLEELSQRGLADRVLSPGLVEHGRATELLAACDVCVSPHVPNPDGTPFFGSPTKLFEYMGLARPIVASDLDQIGEVIEHERTGLLVAPGEPALAAAAVARLLDDAELRGRLGAAALEAAQERHSWTAHATRILDAVAALAEDAPAAPVYSPAQ
jgi:glycosyltransferase involved in cell wall biosynthesis